MARAPEPPPLSFTRQLERLEEIVRLLEGGGQNLDLDDALKLFEEGVERLRAARDRLTAAEAQVKQVLADQTGRLKLDDFDG
ncbi:MAG TPA: exodeoxyribonuclease VII small subunit [Gemmatimonadales bacterium]|nr:exodeoxyribonuclease VII small subunit [Gemmatimonadales bacterium]